jgi:hypothetical protein
MTDRMEKPGPSLHDSEVNISEPSIEDEEVISAFLDDRHAMNVVGPDVVDYPKLHGYGDRDRHILKSLSVQEGAAALRTHEELRDLIFDYVDRNVYGSLYKELDEAADRFYAKRGRGLEGHKYFGELKAELQELIDGYMEILKNEVAGDIRRLASEKYKYADYKITAKQVAALEALAPGDAKKVILDHEALFDRLIAYSDEGLMTPDDFVDILYSYSIVEPNKILNMRVSRAVDKQREEQSGETEIARAQRAHNFLDDEIDT